MLFRNNTSSSYQSLSSSTPLDTASKDAAGQPKTFVHKGLQFCIFLQLAFVTLCCLLVMHIESEDGKSLPWVQAFYNPKTRLWLPLSALLSYVLACVALRAVFPTTRTWLLKAGLALATLSLAQLICYYAAFTVCDPIVRLVRDTSMDHISFSGLVFMPSPQENTVVLSPLSEVAGLGSGWIAESIPDFFECSSETAYALNGRLMVGMALVNISSAFIITTFIAQAFRGTFHTTAHAILLYCCLFVILTDSISAVVINEPVWDWRLLYLGLGSAVVSSYLAVSVVHLPPTPLPPANIGAQLLPKAPTSAGSIARAAWVCIQPLLAVEYFLEKLDEEDPPETPFPEPTTTEACYHA